jgi:hypothetical protein
MKTFVSFAVMSLFAVTLNAADPQPNSDRRWEKLSAEVKQVGGTLEVDGAGAPVSISLYDGNNPLKGKGGLNTQINDAWLEWLAGLTTLTKLDLANCDVHLAGMRTVATLTGLQNLGLTLTPTTDADLVPLAALTELTGLSLASTKCTGTAFRDLTSLKKLSNLNMHFTPADDSGLEAVSRMTSLERLWVVHARFTDDGVKHLSSLKNLKRLGLGSKEKGSTGVALASVVGLPLAELDLFDGQSTDEALLLAAKIPTLRRLTSSYSPTVTDAALAALALLPALEEFHLGGAAKVTDAGILKLAEIKSLRKLKLTQLKQVTEDGVKQLQRRRPDLTIER